MNAIEAGHWLEFWGPAIALRVLSLGTGWHGLMHDHQGQPHGERRTPIRSATKGRNRAAVKFG
jgi:hypothetical protein